MPTAFESYFTALRGKKIAVLGLGVSNRPLVSLLLSFGCTVTGCDRTPRETLDEAVLELERRGCSLSLGDGYLDNLDAELVFRTPGMHPANPALEALRQKGATVTSEMEVFFELCPCRIIAVTGSDGKTTTTTMISEFLKAEGKTVWLGGNIGTPLLSKIPRMTAEDFAVVELSSFQLMDMTHSPEIAVITNLSPNHLDVHKDMDEYVWAKENIFRHQTARGKLILNADNDLTKTRLGPGQTLFFSRQTQREAYADDAYIYLHGQPLVPREEILLEGIHNVENYMAALLAVEGLVSDDTVHRVVKTFGGVEHRQELVRIKDGVRFYNDSIASSPTRTLAALHRFPEKLLLIAGGYDKHIPFDVLGPEVCAHVKRLYLNGATAEKIKAAVLSAAEYRPGHPEILDCGDFESAVRRAATDAQAGDVVLMSPACAAFDQFKNFMVRGDFYKKLVMEL